MRGIVGDGRLLVAGVHRQPDVALVAHQQQLRHVLHRERQAAYAVAPVVHRERQRREHRPGTSSQ
jgi:hypothetical protein